MAVVNYNNRISYKTLSLQILWHGPLALWRESWGSAWQLTRSRAHRYQQGEWARGSFSEILTVVPVLSAILPLGRHRWHPVWTLPFCSSEGQMSPFAIFYIWKWLNIGAVSKTRNCDWKTSGGQCRPGRTVLCSTVVALVLLFVTQVCSFKSYASQRQWLEGRASFPGSTASQLLLCWAPVNCSQCLPADKAGLSLISVYVALWISEFFLGVLSYLRLAGEEAKARRSGDWSRVTQPMHGEADTGFRASEFLGPCLLQWVMQLL